MKLFFVFSLILFFSNQVISQQSQNDSDYLSFRSKNSYKIYQTDDLKVSDYPLLASIQYTTLTNKEVVTITPEDFVQLINSSLIGDKLFKIKRSKTIELSYRLGNTGYVLVGFSEDQILKKYSQSIK